MAEQTTTDLTPPQIRREFESRIIGDLLGPAAGSAETINKSPRSRYLVGMLAPRDTVAMDPDRASEEDARGRREQDGRDEEDRERLKQNRDSRTSGEGDDPADDEGDEAKAAKTLLFPSSIGMSFACEPSCATLDVTATWGKYVKVVIDEGDEGGNATRGWERHPEDHRFDIALVDGKLGPVMIETSIPDGSGGERPLGKVVVSGRARRHNGFWLAELFLDNRQIPQEKNKDEAWLFQPELAVTVDAGKPAFVGRGEALGQDGIVDDAVEQMMLDVQYRDFVEFAVGHGVGTAATTSEADPRRAVKITTAFVPAYEVRNTIASSVDDTPQLEGLMLDMSELADCDDTDRLRGWLAPLADGYLDWLGQQRDRLRDDADALGERLVEAGQYAIEEAEQVAAKVKAGIDAVCSDPDALAAFRFANRTMHLQRIHTEAVGKVRANPDLDVDELLDPTHEATVDVAGNRRWRPFQLAFVLLNIPELVDPTHVDRSGVDALVDLLFFPTGGGKTEAYLGLTAFTFAIRRLHRDRYGRSGGDGIAVMMRYTLRLLTAQQFERAAAMVCAAEVIRRENEGTWGATPFRLGMWVGGSVTPNTSRRAYDFIDEARRFGTDRKSGATPLQLSACPWCGTGFSAAGKDGKAHVQHFLENDARRTLVYCPNWACDFSETTSPGEGVPVVTVDEEVYRLLPTFLIGTIDKFAQVPWHGATRLLFGLASEKCERHGYRTYDLADRMAGPDGTRFCGPDTTYHQATGNSPKALIEPCDPVRPPDLIIQDEFHLVTGPLGSMAGLFETVVDELCSWMPDGSDVRVRPKVVASTATIRRATQQTRGVFDRQVRMFPPQVTDVRDTFFAHQVEPDEIPGRRYLGVCAPGRRLKEVENRVFQTVMASAQDLYDERGLGLGVVADHYMTTVGYFSSIRELAGMRRLADDELPERLWRINSEHRPGLRKRRRPIVEELTSRVASSEIRRKLDQLSVQHDPDSDRRAVDLLLATNMISVGVDVPRWGNMVVVGQPKATAEYVQASSRIGRDPKRPGTVVTVYNWARPRDMSHYEQFEHYHATFYRHVEALSVTPFADRAIDRGLSAVLLGLARSLKDDWNGNRGAQKLDRHDSLMGRVVDTIVDRVRSVEGEEAAADRVRQELTERLDDLAHEQLRAEPDLTYEQRGEGKANQVPLLHRPDEDTTWSLWTLPNSLRNTEPTVNVLYDERTSGLDEPAWEFAGGDDQPEKQDDIAIDAEAAADAVDGVEQEAGAA